jgi:hypothetical protein
MNTKIIAGSAVCFFLMTSQSWAQCDPAITASGTSEHFEGSVVEKNCKKMDVKKNGEEFHINTDDTNGKNTKMFLDNDKMKIENKNGYGQFSGEWPDDEYTRLLPKPPFPLIFANAKKGKFGAMFDAKAVKMNMIESYADKLKSRGFTVDAKESKLSSINHFSYKAKNSNGYFVRFTCGEASTCLINLYTPEGIRERGEKNL